MPEFGATTPNQRSGSRTVGEHFVHIRVLQEAQSHAAELRAEDAGPTAWLSLPCPVHTPSQVSCFGLRFATWISAIASAGPQFVLNRKYVVVDDFCCCQPNFVNLIVQHWHRSYIHPP